MSFKDIVGKLQDWDWKDVVMFLYFLLCMGMSLCLLLSCYYLFCGPWWKVILCVALGFLSGPAYLYVGDIISSIIDCSEDLFDVLKCGTILYCLSGIGLAINFISLPFAILYRWLSVRWFYLAFFGLIGIILLFVIFSYILANVRIPDKVVVLARRLYGLKDRKRLRKERTKWTESFEKALRNSNPKEYELFDVKGRIALVLGNGFDMDLGYGTGYPAFVRSDFWPFRRNWKEFGPMGEFYNERTSNSWYTLESDLAKYDAEHDYSESDEEDYRNLCSGLRKFIQKKQVGMGKCVQNGCATDLLQLLIYKEIPTTVFTFNYTDFNDTIIRTRNNLRESAKMLSLGPFVIPPENLDVHYVHGQANSDSMIFGVGDDDHLSEKRRFMYKTFSNHYVSSQITELLPTFETVIFFGHSFAKIDLPYFKDFLLGILNGRCKCRNLVVYTLNEESELEIKSNLKGFFKEMTLMSLLNSCNFIFVHTCKYGIRRWNHWRVLYSLAGLKTKPTAVKMIIQNTV